MLPRPPLLHEMVDCVDHRHARYHDDSFVSYRCVYLNFWCGLDPNDVVLASSALLRLELVLGAGV